MKPLACRDLFAAMLKSAACIFLVSSLFLTLLYSSGFSAIPESSSAAAGQGIETAPVMIDNAQLFYVRGFKSLAPEERAETIADRIKQAAANPALSTDAIIAVEQEDRTEIMAGKERITSILDADAALEGVSRKVVAAAYVERIRKAVQEYRNARSSQNIKHSVVASILATIILIVLIVVMRKLFGLLQTFLDVRLREHMQVARTRVVKVISPQNFLLVLKNALIGLRFFLVFVLFYVYLTRVFAMFPWTRLFGARLLDYVTQPLKIIGSGLLKMVPDLIFIAVLIIVVRIALKFMHTFFRQIEYGSISITGFYPEWARPTDRILTFLVIVFSVVIAFPYIPGSSTAAFKGVSIFVGVLFSLGSQSAVANSVAGMLVLYRRPFKVGDRVIINDVLGDISAITMQVTHVRTIKNEDVIIPNSQILSNHIINFSSLAREKGLILHTEITIGYDAPWRQVHAMLLKAAERTSGLLKEPSPFVLQKGLDDFYVRYELNACTDSPQMMATIYSELHGNIQDAFNEYGVQIMSPHYLGDPQQEKIVPKNRWFEPPASGPDKDA